MTITDRPSPTASDLAEDVLPAIDELLILLDGQVLVSQNRWVDHLLDLYNLAPNPDLRRELSHVLDEIRHANSVRAAALREALLLLAGAVAVESAFDGLLLASDA